MELLFPKASRVAQLFLLKEQASRMPLRSLGKTGLMVTGFGLGGQALLEMDNRQKEATDLINKAIDLGINYFDTATLYGPSRYYLGRALGIRRKNIILASKVRDRTYNGAKKELDESFNLLKTDYIDIVQLHSIENQNDKNALKKNGALQILIEAKNAGKIKFIGFTGHYDPKIMQEFMDEYDFDTVLVAVNPAVPEFDPVVQKAWSKNMGVIAMKIMARGVLPLVYPASLLLYYAMQKSDVAIAGCTNQADIEKNVLAAANFNSNQSFNWNIPPELKRKAAYFMKGFESEKWPHTYQPDLPNIQYEN